MIIGAGLTFAPNHRFRGASATALPQIGALVGRWSADTITGKNDGDAVSSWADSVGGYTATQATGIRQPIYKTNIAGGKPALQFDGARFMDAGRPTTVAAAMDGTTRTVMVVFKTIGTTSNGMMVNTSPGGGGNYMLVADGTNAGRFSETFPHASTAFSTVMSVKTTGQGGGRTGVNGSMVYIKDADATTSGGQNIWFGGIQNATFMVNAYIFDILFWNVGLTQPEILQAEKWARDKYSQAYPWAGYADFHIYAGDSQTQGSGAPGTASYPYKSAALLSRPYGTWTNIGQGGASMTQVDANCAINCDPVGAMINKPTKVAVFEYYNQRGLGAVAAAAASRLCISNRRAIANTKVIFGTSFSSTLDPDATRTAYNADFDATHTGMDAYVPLHNDTSIGISGAAAADGNVTYFLDGIHLRAAGNQIVANLISAGITAA